MPGHFLKAGCYGHFLKADYYGNVFVQWGFKASLGTKIIMAIISGLSFSTGITLSTVVCLSDPQIAEDSGSSSFNAGGDFRDQSHPFTFVAQRG